MRSCTGNTVLYRGFSCGEASQRDCVSEFEMVYGNTVRPDGEDQYRMDCRRECHVADYASSSMYGNVGL